MLTTRAVLLLLTVTPGILPETWTRFRGPEGAGIAVGDYETEFGVQKNLLWKRPIPQGKSSPVLTESHIFLTAEEGENLVVLCLDRKTGKTVWERSVRRTRSEFQHSLNSSASATPVTDGENVYAFFGNYGLVSYDETGKERWRQPLGPFSSLWGMAASPVLAAGSVIVLLDGFGESNISAFDQKTGALKWKRSRLPFSLNYSTPIVRRANGVEEIITIGSGRVIRYDAKSGQERWSTEMPNGSIISSPASDGNILFTQTHSAESVPSFDDLLTKSDRNGDGVLSAGEFGEGEVARVLTAFASMSGTRDGIVERKEWAEVWRWTGKPALAAVRLEGTEQHPAAAWTHLRSVARVPTPLVLNGIVYMVANGGILTALKVSDGTPGKIGRLEGALDNYWASPVAAGGKIFLTTENGKVVVLKAGMDWQILAVNDLGEQCFATPALSRGQILIRTESTLWNFGLK
ncbi:MAG: PQQ-binding-like beta-propeller repeat protein [Bryobacteraceae bacterium]|nr:PQQ-binding-like beta-propeller repeat protein [Bryobacteraceae bacterium]